MFLVPYQSPLASTMNILNGSKHWTINTFHSNAESAMNMETCSENGSLSILKTTNKGKNPIDEEGFTKVPNERKLIKKIS
jgi:hypothetical protein